MQVVKYVRDLLQLPLVNICGEDLMNGQRKMVLAVLWQLMRIHIRALLARVPLNGVAVSDAELDTHVIGWANRAVRSTGSKSQVSLRLSIRLAYNLIELRVAANGSTKICVSCLQQQAGAGVALKLQAELVMWRCRILPINVLANSKLSKA